MVICYHLCNKPCLFFTISLFFFRVKKSYNLDSDRYMAKACAYLYRQCCFSEGFGEFGQIVKKCHLLRPLIWQPTMSQYRVVDSQSFLLLWDIKLQYRETFSKQNSRRKLWFNCINLITVSYVVYVEQCYHTLLATKNFWGSVMFWKMLIIAEQNMMAAHHHRHHPQISWRHKSQTKLQGRSKYHVLG